MPEDEEESDKEDDDDEDEEESTEESTKMEVDVKPKQKKTEETPNTVVRYLQKFTVCHYSTKAFGWEGNKKANFLSKLLISTCLYIMYLYA